MEALKLKENLIEKYVEGELRSNDTLVDVKNGYYEEFYLWDNATKVTLRQAAIFKNKEDTKLLGITINSWDFACMLSKTSFYEIAQSKKQIKSIDIENILPHLTYQDFLKDTSKLSSMNAEVQKLEITELDKYDSFEAFLKDNSMFDIKYKMPRVGTSVTASIDVCDYYLGSDEWLKLKEKYFKEVNLKYDSKMKKFGVHKK